MAKTLYQILNVAETAGTGELHQAFRLQEQLLLDDGSNQALSRLERVREAFQILSIPGKRLDYDRQLAASRTAPTSAPGDSSRARYLSPTFLACLIALIGLLVYWHLESQKIRQAQVEANLRQQTVLMQAQIAAEQEERERVHQQMLATQQAELDRQQIAAEQQMSRQADESFRTVVEQQLDDRRSRDERELKLMEQQNAMNLRQQEQELNERNLELQYRQPAMALDLKSQAEQQALARQRNALQQHDAAIDAIRDLQAAKLREYQRNQYGSGGISTSNPAEDP